MDYNSIQRSSRFGGHGTQTFDPYTTWLLVKTRAPKERRGACTTVVCCQCSYVCARNPRAPCLSAVVVESVLWITSSDAPMASNSADNRQPMAIYCFNITKKVSIYYTASIGAR